MADRVSNPFFFESPSSAWEFTDRDAEMRELDEHLSGIGRRVLLHGRRRMGKTSILDAVARTRGRRLILVDVSTVASVAELAEKLLAAAPEPQGTRFQQVVKLAQRYFKSVAITAGRVTLGGEFRPLNDGTTLEGALGFLHDCSALDGGGWTVAFDEFQDLRTIGGDQADWKLRGVIQRHRNLNYVFSGSDHRLVAWMTDPAAPFFKQLHQIEIGPIDPGHLAGWLRARAKVGGLREFPFAEQIVALAGPCTGDVVRLAKTVFDFARDGRLGDVVGKAFDTIALQELNTEFQARWRMIPSTAARSMLRALAEGLPHTSADTLRRYGIRSVSTAGSATAWLIDKQILVRDGDQRPIFDDPYFRRWVRANAAG